MIVDALEKPVSKGPSGIADVPEATVVKLVDVRVVVGSSVLVTQMVEVIVDSDSGTVTNSVAVTKTSVMLSGTTVTGAQPGAFFFMPKPGPDRQWERGGADPALANGKDSFSVIWEGAASP